MKNYPIDSLNATCQRAKLGKVIIALNIKESSKFSANTTIVTTTKNFKSFNQLRCGSFNKSIYRIFRLISRISGPWFWTWFFRVDLLVDKQNNKKNNKQKPSFSEQKIGLSFIWRFGLLIGKYGNNCCLKPVSHNNNLIHMTIQAILHFVLNLLS